MPRAAGGCRNIGIPREASPGLGPQMPDDRGPTLLAPSGSPAWADSARVQTQCRVKSRGVVSLLLFLMVGWSGGEVELRACGLGVVV